MTSVIQKAKMARWWVHSWWRGMGGKGSEMQKQKAHLETKSGRYKQLRSRRWSQSILKEINPEYSLQGLLLGSNTLATWWEELTRWKRPPDAGKDWRQKEKGETEDEIVRKHHRLNEHDFEQILGDSGGQRSLVCCSPWVVKSQTTRTTTRGRR